MAKLLDWRLLLLFFTFLSFSLAASSNSFCKCTCFTNSSLIPLTPPKKAPTTPSTGGSGSGSDTKAPAAVGKTCNDCNKEFCKSYGLAICAEATDEDMFTTCFKRDSAKDEAVIYIFIIATMGLLAWAVVKPYVEKIRDGRARGVSYAPVGNSGTGTGR